MFSKQRQSWNSESKLPWCFTGCSWRVESEGGLGL